ncbi:MAG: hypothetical protein J2P35_18070 [Actinobacteria bacterium]|nr:hypothetical protein [Actinomycetota bacterium]
MMPTFVFVYRNPAGYVPAEESAAPWLAWFEDMGEQLAEVGGPVVSRAAVGNCQDGATELGGYSLINAQDLETAVTIAKGCPYLAAGGGVQVGQVGEVPGPRPGGPRAS